MGGKIMIVHSSEMHHVRVNVTDERKIVIAQDEGGGDGQQAIIISAAQVGVLIKFLLEASRISQADMP